MTEAVYGTWKSPISSQLATESSVSFQELHLSFDDEVFWSELRYEEGGRYVICSKKDNGDCVQWTPQDFSARTLVHEYGGGSFFLHQGMVFFSNFKDQRLYKQETATSEPVPVTPADKGWRYADGEYCCKLNKIYCVREDHSTEGKEAQNTIVAIDPSNQEQYVLSSGCDFYSSPRVSPDGKRIAWFQWNHPNMPWNTTELWVADLEDNGSAIVKGTAKKVAGGGTTSVMQPRWSPCEGLFYIGDQTDWWNLYLITTSGEHVAQCPMEKELGGPQWQFACHAYDFQQGKLVLSHKGELGILDNANKKYQKVDSAYSSHSMVQMSSDSMVYCVAGGPAQFPCVVKINPTSGQADEIKKSRSVPVDAGYLSLPSHETWVTGNGEKSHGYYYPPQNQDYKAPVGTLPPMLVKAHGGPTSNTSNILNLKIQYWTSRGFAILDVDYRGSTGYGKQYRHRLNGQWGVYDVEDCCSGALYLCNQLKADPKRLCIDGGSAGGYTTLACLAFKDVFCAGASHYGICDLEVLAGDTHKFESRYCDQMLAPFTPEFMHIYLARSPIKHIDKFNCPIAFFQGDEDKVVPPNQAEMMFQAVKEKGLPCALVMFEGEQHGFRKAENIQKALDGEFYFFAKVFGFEPADKHCKLAISNL